MFDEKFPKAIGECFMTDKQRAELEEATKRVKEFRAKDNPLMAEIRLRDLFALFAPAANHGKTNKEQAEDRYKFADAMLEVRNRAS